jgi:hypothetical protein
MNGFERELSMTSQHMIEVIQTKFNRVDKTQLSLRALTRIYERMAFKVDLNRPIEDIKE